MTWLLRTSIFASFRQNQISGKFDKDPKMDLIHVWDGFPAEEGSRCEAEIVVDSGVSQFMAGPLIHYMKFEPGENLLLGRSRNGVLSVEGVQAPLAGRPGGWV
jgi:hypothetical protein